MPDDTATALNALLQQVQTLTDKVEAQDKEMKGIRKLNARLLDEKKDLERAFKDPSAHKDTLIEKLDAAQRRRELELAGFKVDDDGNATYGNQSHYIIKRSEARDSEAYRKAKELAGKAGLPLKVVDDIPRQDNTIRNVTKADVIQSHTFEVDDTHEGVRYIRADMHTGDGMVRRHQMAEQAGLRIKTFRTIDDLPPHVQTKFHLMERAADAAQPDK